MSAYGLRETLEDSLESPEPLEGTGVDGKATTLEEACRSAQPLLGWPDDSDGPRLNLHASR